MCRRGNQSIFKSCRDAILKQTGRTSMTNREMRELLKRRGGCVNGAQAAEVKGH